MQILGVPHVALDFLVSNAKHAAFKCPLQQIRRHLVVLVYTQLL